MNCYEWLSKEYEKGNWPVIKETRNIDKIAKEGLEILKKLDEEGIEIPSTLSKTTSFIYFASSAEVPQRQVALAFGQPNQFHNQQIHKLAAEYPLFKKILQEKNKRNKYSRSKEKIDLDKLIKKFSK